jgi:hypothetical protein
LAIAQSLHNWQRRIATDQNYNRRKYSHKNRIPAAAAVVVAVAKEEEEAICRRGCKRQLKHAGIYEQQ